MSGKALYIRVRGKVLGPFSLADLRSLRDRGQFRRFHEISEDRRSWTPATSLGELFPSEPVARVVEEEIGFERVSDEASAGARKSADEASGSSDNEWYYVDEAGAQQGPISKAELVGLWGRGTLDDSSYVWNAKMTSWQAINSLSELGTRPARGGQSGKSLPLNRFAFLSFILGIIWLGGVASIAAIVFGYLALRQMERRKGQEGGRRMALIGIFAGAGMLVVVTPLTGYFLYQYYGTWAHVQRLGGSATAEEITAAFKHRVYLVRADINHGLVSSGSGVMIASNRGRGLIVTNLHVVIANDIKGRANNPAWRPVLLQDIRVKNPTQIMPKGCQLAAYHHRLDLALLIIEMESQKPSSIAVVRQRGLRQGEVAVALGNPLRLEFLTSPGVISSTSDKEGLVRTTCPINSGNSGGPLFLARRGLLAAITTEKFVFAESLGGCIPAEEVVESLHRRLTDVWEWRHDYKDITLELADLIPLED